MASLIDRIQNAMLGGAGADKMRDLLTELNIPLGGAGENAMRDIRKSILFSTDSEDELRTGMGNLGLTGISTGVRPMPRIRAAILLNRSDSETQLRTAIDDLLGETAQAPTDIAWAGSHTVVEDAALGTVIGGALSFTDPNVGATGVFSIPDITSKFDIDGTSVILAGVLDFEDAASHNVTIRFTDQGGLYIEETFPVTVTDVAEGVPDEDAPPDDGDVEVDGEFDVPPTITVTAAGNIKISGKKKAGSVGKILYNLGPLLANYKATLKYTTQFSLLENEGKAVFVGFVFKDGNDFHAAGQRGDGATGLDTVAIYGDDKWNTGTGFTEAGGADSLNGTQAGPNWAQMQTAEDGNTYDFRTSGDDGETFDDDDLTGQAPTPFADVADAAQHGIGIILPANEGGPFVVEISVWIKDLAIVYDDFVGCVAKLNADLVAQNFSAGTTYMPCSGTDVVDTDALHDPASNNTRITIPSALNNRYGIFVAHTTFAVLDASPLFNVISIRKSGGANHYAGGIWGTLQGTITGRTSYMTVSTPPLLLVTNDYYEALVQIQDTSTTLVSASTSFSLFVIG